MKSQIYHAPLGTGINRTWVQLEKLEDGNDSGRMIGDAIGGITVFALIGILMVLAFTF